MILLTGLGVATVFWEPLTALALGAPASETVGEAHLPAADAGATGAALPSTTGAATSAGATPDGSGSS